MSTKTTIKRVALVAAVALTLGGFSAVSASATDNLYIFAKTADGLSSGTVANVTANGVAGPANYVQIGLTNADNGIVTVAGASSVILSSSDASVVVATGGASASTSNSANNAVLNVSTPVVGTITVNYYKNVSAGVFASTPTESVVITVNATASSGVFSAAKSSIYLASGETGTAVAADAAVTASAAANFETAVATVQVALADALGAGYKDTVTATITSGPGVLFASNDSRTVGIDSASFKASASAPLYSASVATYLNAELRSAYFGIFANGQAGVSTIVLKNTAGTVLATKTVTFSGTTVASAKVTVLKANVLNSTSATSGVFAVNLFDSAGNEITTASVPTAAVATGSTVGGTVTCTSYNTTAAAYLCSAAASSTQAALTTDASETYTFTAGTVTATATVKFVSGVAATVAISTDATVDAGSKITYKLTATNANGNSLPDGAYTPGSFIAGVATSASLVSTPFAAADTVTLVNGVATSSTYAPFGSAPLTITWTLKGTAGTANAAGALTNGTYFVGAGLVKTITGTDVAATVTVNGSADSALAVDAANAATDAANAAAEEASNATEAASEALAAVNSLATTVASLIAGIKKQLVALTALVKKLQK